MASKNKKPPVRVSKWAHTIWRAKHGISVLMTLPSDGAALAKLISEYGEMTVAVAWALWVFGEHGKTYFTEPPERLEEHVRKDGGKWLTSEEDQAAVTKFPMRQFLKVSEGPIMAAEELVQHPEALTAWEHRQDELCYHNYAKNVHRYTTIAELMTGQ